MLNQNYTRIGMKNNCRVALGPYSNPFCHVADSFRCIVLVDESKVDYADPPFLNRFEKQFLSFADVMDYEESSLVKELENWMDSITQIEGKPFTKYSAVPFYNEELIFSLVLYLRGKHGQSDVSLFEECKMELLWIMRPEVFVRLAKVDDSTIQQASDSIRNRYFELPLHDGLGNLIQYQINEDKEEMSVVFTNSNIHTKMSDELINWRCQSENLGAFKSEKQLSVKLQQFWNSVDVQILLIHCSAQDDDKHIMLTKSLIEKYRAEYLGKPLGHCQKMVYLIVHLGCRDAFHFSDESSSSLSQMNYLSGWKLLLLENLEHPRTSLPVFCSKTLLRTMEDMLPMTDFIKEELFWAFTRIQYGTHGRDAESINCIIGKIQSCHAFLGILGELIWSYVQDCYKGQGDADWFVTVACDIQALNTSSFLVDALERHIRMVVKNPLAKIVYKFEQLGALDSYFIEDANSAERRELWLSSMANDKIFSYSVDDKPIKDAAGPECYQCDTPDLGLKLPFSRVIYESIEETKDLFTDEVARSKIKCELEPDDNLPEEIMKEIVLQQESIILKRLSDILVSDDIYWYLINDYVTDFCNLYSYTLSTVLERDARIEYMKWTLQQKVQLDVTEGIYIFTSLHCTGWLHIPLFGSVIQLLELCSKIFGSESINILTQFKKAVKNNDAVPHVETDDSQESQSKDSSEFEDVNDIHGSESEVFIKSSSGAPHLIEELVEEFQKQDQNDGICVCVDNSTHIHKNAELPFVEHVPSIVESDSGMNKVEDRENTNEDIVYSTQNDDLPDVVASSQLETDIPHMMDTASLHSSLAGVNETICNVYPEKVDVICHKNANMYETNNICTDTLGTYKNESDNTADTEELIIHNFAPDNTEHNSELDRSIQKGMHEIDAQQHDHKDTQMIHWSGNLIQDLVSFVCAKMIPTTEHVCHFTGIKHWQVMVRNILIVAAEVSTESQTLHALRLCNDIVTDIVFPHNMDLSSLQDIGNSLVSGNVGSDDVFSGLLDMFEHLEDTESTACVQRIICQFLIRCLSANTDTTAYTYLFNAVKQKTIPEEEMHLLKAPLRFLVQQELGENENVFRDILADCVYTVKESSDFLSTLDSCLYSLFMQDRVESPFVLLIVDLLQETFEQDEDIDSSYEFMLTSGRILQENNSIGLAFIIACAYLKAAISYIADVISVPDQTDNDMSILLTQLNAVLSGLAEVPIHKSLLEYFLKGLGKNSAISTVMKYCSNIAAEYPFLENIDWTDGYLSKTFEGNPLALYVPSEVLLEGETCMTAQQSTESFNTSMLDLIKLASKQSGPGLLLLYSLTLKEYYLPRYRGMLDDMDRSYAAMLLEIFEKHQHSAVQQTLMECIVGKHDFKCGYFMLGEESSFQQYMVNSVLMSTFAQLLCCCDVTVGQLSASFLRMCLLNPVDMKKYFLPGFPNRSSSMVDEEGIIDLQEDPVFSLCECNRRLLFRLRKSTLICVVCSNEISEDSQHKSLKMFHPAQPTAGYTCSPHIAEMPLAVRKLSSFSTNVLQMLVKGCLLGSVALGISESSQIKEIIDDLSLDIDLSHQLEAEIDNHWKVMKESLNMNDHDLGIIVHSVLHQGRHILFKESNEHITALQRELWESRFETLVAKVLDNRLSTIQLGVKTINNLYELSMDSVETVIREVNDYASTSQQNHCEQLAALFRISAKPSRSDFLCQLWFHRDSYPFLTMFLKQESQLVLPKHIHQILQWHMATVVNTSYFFKRYDCLKMTVREFHDSLTDLNKRKVSKKKFESFKNSWSVVKKALENIEDFETLLPMNNETKMSDCLILDTKCDMYKALSFLISTQNDFIDLALQLSFTSKNLQFLLRDTDVACFKVVPVTELKKEHLINLSVDLDESLAQESNSGLAYGMGKQVFYDFQSIEKELCIDLLVGKAYISFQALPRIVFTDELYRNFITLLAEVRQCIPQETLPNDIEVAFVKTSKDMANMSLELINYIDMILTLLKKTKCDPHKSLTDFVAERINILGQRFPSQYLPSPESRVKICHIVSLHELLEELSVDRIMGSLSDAYSTDLESSMNDHFTKMPVTSIRKAELVSKAMKRFIYRCIFMGDIDTEQPLIQFLSEESFWPTSIFRNGKLKIDGKEEDVKDIIPPCVLVCHVVVAVSLLSESIEIQKQGELRMDRVITSWKSSSGERTSKVTRQKKAVKKLRKS